MHNNKNKIISSLIWRFLEKFGSQGVTFVVSILLARLLDPDAYGTIAIVNIFISIMQVFVDSGLANSLIQKKEVDDLDFSSVFYFNVGFCLLLYMTIFLFAPAISSFYSTPELKLVIRILGLNIVISGINNVQQAYVSRRMMFQKNFYSTLGGTIGAAIIGIVMAYRGFGVWALVAQHLFKEIIGTFILWVNVEWRPKLLFSYHRLKVLLSFGWKLLAAKLIDTIYENARSLIIGKKYSSTDLAFYNKGKQFSDFATLNINASIESVLFPAMSMEQDNLEHIRSMTSRSIKIVSYVTTPIMVGLSVCAEPLIKVILTAKWINCVPYMRIFCVASSIVPVTLANLNAIKAIGYSEIYLKLEIARKAVNTLSLLVSMWYGPKAIAYSYLLNCVVNLYINSYPNKKILNYGYSNQIKDMFPAISLSMFMGLVTYSITFINVPDLIKLLIQIPLSVVIYIILSFLIKEESFMYILNTIKRYKINKEKK